MRPHLHNGRRGAWLLAVSVCVASAAAQDVPSGQNPYVKRARSGPKLAVDPALARAVGARVAECYQSEQGAPLSAEDAALLREYGADVVRELASGLASTGCEAGKRASAACLKGVAALACEQLAEPIVAAGWDRNLTPQARAEVAVYARLLATRETRCSERAAEEVAIVNGVRGDRLAVLIEAQVVIGQCQLFPDQLPACETLLQGVPCERISALNERGELQTLCGAVLRCVKKPAPSSASH